MHIQGIINSRKEHTQLYKILKCGFDLDTTIQILENLVRYVRTLCPDVYISLKPRANGRDIVGCYLFYPFAHPIACSWEFFHKVLNSSNVELRENGRNNSQHCWELLGLFARSFSKCFVLFYLLYLMPYWLDKHQT